MKVDIYCRLFWCRRLWFTHRNNWNLTLQGIVSAVLISAYLSNTFYLNWFIVGTRSGAVSGQFENRIRRPWQQTSRPRTRGQKFISVIIDQSYFFICKQFEDIMCYFELLWHCFCSMLYTYLQIKQIKNKTYIVFLHAVNKNPFEEKIKNCSQVFGNRIHISYIRRITWVYCKCVTHRKTNQKHGHTISGSGISHVPRACTLLVSRHESNFWLGAILKYRVLRQKKTNCMTQQLVQ
jgi:hypothetical protein